MTAARRKPTAPVSEEEILQLQNPEAERAVLAEMMESGESIGRARALVGPDDFYGPAHRTIFETLLSLCGKGIPADPVILKDELARRGELEAVGGPAFIGSILDAPCGRAGLEYYAGIVRERASRRRLMEASLALAKSCTNGHSTSELRESAAELFRQSLAADPESNERSKPIGALLSDYSESVSAPQSGKLRTGFRTLDDAMDGIALGEVLTVVARPSVGKSAIAGQIIVNCVLKGIPSVFFSLEMPRLQALERLLQTAWGLTRHQVESLARSGYKDLTTSQLTSLDSIEKNVGIVDRGKSNIGDLDRSLEEAVGILGKAPRLVVVDYLNLMGSGSKNLPLYQRVSEAVVDLKSFAKRHHVALVLLCQAGRDQQNEARSEGAGPLGLDSPRDSGQVEEAADFMVTLWRPELRSTLSPEEKAELKGALKGHLVKNRRGPTMRLHLHLDAPTLRIREEAPGGVE